MAKERKVVDMKISDLFSAEMEPDLNKCVGKFTTLSDLFSAIPQLYARLESQNIELLKTAQ